MTAATVKIVHRTIRGAAGERRIPIQYDRWGHASIDVPDEWLPQPRTGVAQRWELITRRSDGSGYYEAA